MTYFKHLRSSFHLVTYGIFLMLLVFALNSCLNQQDDQQNNPLAVKGVLDLSRWSFQKQGTTKLDGDWEFYWQKLLTPTDFLKPDKDLAPEWITVPKSWNSYKIKEKPLGAEGYATFKLTIKNPNSTKNLVLEIEKMETAYRLWVDGKEIASNGVVGSSSVISVPYWRKTQVPYSPQGGFTDLILQVSNYSYKRGGFHNSIKLGLEADLEKQRDLALLFEQLIFGSFLIMGLYHLGLFYFRRKDPSTLFFGLCCLVFALRTVVMGERIILTYFNISWELLITLEYLTFYIGPILFIIFTWSMFPNEFRKVVILIGLLINTGFALFTLVTSARIHSYIISYAQVVVFVYAIYLTYGLIKAAIAKREGVFLYLIGSSFIVWSVINDILYSKKIISTGFISTICVFLFIFFHSVVLAKRFSKAFAISEELTEFLEKKVEERTRELAIKHNEQKTLLHVLCHDLSNPLASIKGTLEYAEEDDSVFDKMKGLLLNSTNYGLDLITLVREFAALEESNYTVELKDFQLEPLILNALSILDHRFREKNIKVNLEVNSQLKVKVEQVVFVNSVLNNLISNAIKFSNPHSTIDIKSVSQDGKVIIEIIDYGIGMPASMLDHLFDMEFTAVRSGTKGERGTGFGMPIVQRIIRGFGGTIDVQSKDVEEFPEEHGTTVKLTLQKA